VKVRPLQALVMHVSARCDQTCAHCSIWRPKGRIVEMGFDERCSALREARELGARSVLFTGGEPLLCDHLEALARFARSLDLDVQIATNGLALARAADWICETAESVYVSLEGPLMTHDAIRGSSMWKRLASSVAVIRARPERPRLIARSVLQGGTCALVEETVHAAKSIGFDAISFLPVDTTSEAFGGAPEERRGLRPSTSQLAALRQGIARLAASGQLGTFVLEDELAMAALASRLAAASAEAPACNAPEWSIVIEADGAARPCFFQPPVGAPAVALRVLRESTEFAAALQRLGPRNEICVRCVCPKFTPHGIKAVVVKVKAALRPFVRPRAVRFAPEPVA
jgi:Fe-coproporphyrin III synthase